MSRSADRLLPAVVLAAGLLSAPTAASAASPVPGGTPTSLAGLSAPVLDITGPVLDIGLTTSSLDDTESTVEEGRTRKLVIASSVLFPESRATLSGTAQARLSAVAEQIRSGGAQGTVTVDGYTDNQGSAAKGLVLSRQRAAAATAVLAKALAGTGLRFVQHGYGEANPIAANDNPDGSPNRKGQAKNRRVEITFTPAAG